eukprot:3116886-Amphidinium_carterae.1
MDWLMRTMQLRQAPAQLSETGGDAAAIAHALTAALKEVVGGACWFSTDHEPLTHVPFALLLPS